MQKKNILKNFHFSLNILKNKPSPIYIINLIFIHINMYIQIISFTPSKGRKINVYLRISMHNILHRLSNSSASNQAPKT